MRGYKSIIQEAELLAMSPEAVAEFLKKRAKQSVDELDHDPVDEETEEALRGRSNPLIDLALARYARSTEALRPIFQSSQPCGAIRLAVLSNGTRWPAYNMSRIIPLTLVSLFLCAFLTLHAKWEHALAVPVLSARFRPESAVLRMPAVAPDARA
jgi:hypothetical protein